ncbi:MAG: hypothetical protein ACJ0BD_03350 [Gammaproteobacteria bacterium]|tara:strand:- start:239 stop:724 length:486 start_codon:yes stop_codon:yes gene_type:complete
MGKNSPSIKGIPQLKEIASIILNFESTKHKAFKKVAKKDFWNEIYINDNRYELLRLVIFACYVEKGFFVMSDLTGLTSLNVRSIERMLSRGSQLKYFNKKQGSDKRVVQYYPTSKSLELMKAHVEVLVNLKNILGDKDIIDKIGITSQEDLYRILDSVVEN